MATQTELEELVVRLTGDGSKYKQMLTEARTDTESTAKSVEQAGGKVEGISKSLSSFASTAMQALGAFGAASWLKGALSAYGEQMGAERRLRLGLETNGRNVAQLTEQYKQFASQIQATTTVGDEAALALLAQAEAMGVTGESAQRAVRNAISAAAAYPQMFGSAEGAMRQMIGLEQGHAQMLARLIPELRGISDPTLQAARAQEIMARNWRYASENARTLGGRIAQLKNQYGDFLEEIGEVVSMFVKPVKSWLVDVAKEAVTWLQSLSKESKIAIVLATSLAAGILALGPTIAAWGMVVTPFIGTITAGLALLPTLFGPIGIGIAVVGVGVAALIQKLGGLEATWTVIKNGATTAMAWVKRKFDDLVTWSQPIVQAASGFFRTLWSVISEGAESAWNFVVSTGTTALNYVTELWDSMTDGAVVDWDTIRDSIRDTFLFAEFTVTNFETVWNYAWAGIKYGAVSFANFLLNNVFMAMLFNPIMGTAGLMFAFSANWESVWTHITNYTGDAFRWMSERAGTFFGNLWAALTGADVDWSGLWDGFTSSFSLSLTGITIPALDELEQQLLEEFEAAGEALDRSFNEFRDRRLREMALESSPTVIRNAERSGLSVGSSFNRGVQKEMEKLDAVLRGSAESLSRIAAYRDRIMGVSSSTRPGAAPTGASPTPGAFGGMTPSPSARPATPSSAATGAATEAGQTRIVAALTAIATILTSIRDRPSEALEAATE